MNSPQRLPIAFAQEESFSASLNIVRALSAGELKRDPQAQIVSVRSNPPKQVINPRVRTFQPLSEWRVRMLGYVARTGKTLAQLQAERAERERLRWQKSKKAKAA